MRHYTFIAHCFIFSTLLFCSCGKKDAANTPAANEYAVPSDEEQLAELERICSQLPEESFEDRFECFNPWHKDYFKNEWGEQDLTKPYLYATMGGSNWNIHIDYLPADSEDPYGIFRFYIVDSDGYITSSYEPVNILVRGSDGETMVVDVTGTRDYVTFVEDPSTVYALMQMLDQETFDIQMQFGKWNERHSTQAKWYCDPGFFRHAIDTML